MILSRLCKGDVKDYEIGQKPPWNRPIERLAVKKFRYDSTKARIYLNDDFFIGKVPRPVWNFEIGGKLQISSWLQVRRMDSADYRKKPKYAFLRPLTYFELWEFLRILTAVRETLKTLKDFPPFEDIKKSIVPKQPFPPYY